MQDQIFISQMKYTKKLLEKFRMIDYQLISMPIEPSLHLSYRDYSPSINSTLYHHLIEGLIYLAYTMLDICYVVNYILRFMYELKKAH